MSNLSPNKQNLILLKNQLKLVQGGYRLLQEKRTGLIVAFLKMAKDGKQLEQKVQAGLNQILINYLSAISFVSLFSLLQVVNQNIKVSSLNLQKKKISGVLIDILELKITPPLNPKIKPNIQHKLESFAQFFPIILELQQLKLNATKLANQILKTSRQIANLERKVDDIKSQIKYINSALMQRENFEKSVLLKIFN